MTTTVSNRPAVSRYRWMICGLLFFATVIAYLDRGVLAYLEKTLEGIIGFDRAQYSNMTAAFSAAYALGMLFAGRITDRVGTRLGFSVAVVLWSLAAMAQGAASTPVAFGVGMFFLGLGEAANFPACIKTVAEWFPKMERALATAIFNSGANIGNIVAPALVPAFVAMFGWRGSFVAAGALGFVWLFFWLLMYRKPEDHPKVSERELEIIQSDPPERIKPVSWGSLFTVKETWAFAFAKFLTDPIWWFYVFWLPPFLQGTFHLSLAGARIPLIIAYATSCVGGVAGGWISSTMLKRGASLNVARKTAMAICGAAVVPVCFVPFSHSLWLVVALLSLATAGHQGWSANVFTLASDMFPRAAVASVVGIGGMIGAAGNVLFQYMAGRVSYLILFSTAATAYMVALLIVHLLAPKLASAELK